MHPAGLHTIPLDIKIAQNRAFLRCIPGVVAPVRGSFFKQAQA